MKTRFAHINIVSRDWKKLCRFYCEVFGCREKPPQRDLSGGWLDRLTGLKNAGIRGMHLYLPGYGDDGPTLEIFEYSENSGGSALPVNGPGFAHIAFAVEDVDAVLQKLLDAGGSTVGEVVKAGIKNVGQIHLVYARDPEGNIIEIQKWN